MSRMLVVLCSQALSVKWDTLIKWSVIIWKRCRFSSQYYSIKCDRLSTWQTQGWAFVHTDRKSKLCSDEVCDYITVFSYWGVYAPVVLSDKSTVHWQSRSTAGNHHSIMDCSTSNINILHTWERFWLRKLKVTQCCILKCVRKCVHNTTVRRRMLHS